MTDSRSPHQPRPSLPEQLGHFLLTRLADLEARSERLARQSEAKGDVKTALMATRLSVSILTQMAKLAARCPQAAQSWAPPTQVDTLPASATPAATPAANTDATTAVNNSEPQEAADPNAAGTNTPDEPAAPQGPEPYIYRVPIVTPVNTHWFR